MRQLRARLVRIQMNLVGRFLRVVTDKKKKRMPQFFDLELSDLSFPQNTRARKQLGIKTTRGFSSGRVTLFYYDEERVVFAVVS